MEFKSFNITKDDHDRRADRIVRRFLPKLSLSGIYKLMRKGLVRIDGKKVSPEFHVIEGSSLEIAVGLLDTVKDQREPQLTGFIPEILHESADLLFINKPAGLPVHGDGGLDSLIAQSASSDQSLSFRTGPLHRLDRDTTGILAFSRSLTGARWFSLGVHEHHFQKYYLGIVEGPVTETAEWRDSDEDDKPMITLVRPVTRAKATGHQTTLLRFQIVTGRKHQIRIQSQKRGHPLIGDSRYNPRKSPDSYCLHAWQMLFPADRPEDIPEKIVAPLPDRFKTRIRELFGADVLAHIERGELYWNQYDEHQ